MQPQDPEPEVDPRCRCGLHGRVSGVRTVALVAFILATTACGGGSRSSGSATRFCADERRGFSPTAPGSELISAGAVRDAPLDIRPDVETVARWVNQPSDLSLVIPSGVQAAATRFVRYSEVVCGATLPAGLSVLGAGHS
jgi:hypothetical protein